MAQTITINKSDGVSGRMAVISHIEDSSAVAFDVNIGFTPRYIKVTNEDGDSYMEWYQGMADAEAMVLIGDTDPVTYSKVTSNGITLVDDGTTLGFTVGLDTNVNVVNQQLSIVAIA